MGKTVLIVDDDDLIVDFIDAIVSSAGYETISAGDGFEGVKMARDHAPDLIFMDFILPELSGVEARKMLKADSALDNIPVIAMTAFPFKEDDEMFEEEDFAAYLPKPLSKESVLEILARFLD